MNRAGAEVRIFDQQGQLLGLRLVSTGDGYNSHSNLPVHCYVDTVDIVTPSGTAHYRNISIADYLQIFCSTPAIIH